MFNQFTKASISLLFKTTSLSLRSLCAEIFLKINDCHLKATEKELTDKVLDIVLSDPKTTKPKSVKFLFG